MKNHFPGRKHTSILTHLLALLSLSVISSSLVNAQSLNTSACPSGYTYNAESKRCISAQAVANTCNRIAASACGVAQYFGCQGVVSQACEFFFNSASQTNDSIVELICKDLKQTTTPELNTCRNVFNHLQNEFAGNFQDAVRAPVCGPGLTASNNGICVKGGFTNKLSPEEGCTNGINTALGCLPYNTKGFTISLLTFLAGTAGAISLVIMLIATIQIMTGGNNAEQVKKGKELFASAITGLLFIIFSVTLLRIVAGDIIQLPGFK
ncbi:MAG: hypothetical protein Fur0011_1930 [Candidatus Microgenomates bacterium]